MTDEPTTIQPDRGKPAQPRRKVKGVIFIIVSAFAAIVIPAVTAVSIAIMQLVHPAFYTGILKDGRLITAFVEARNWQTDQAINEEIEKSLDLTRFKAEFEAIKARYDRTRSAYEKISRSDEIESLKKERREVKNLEWKLVKHMLPGESDFDRIRGEELKKIDGRLDQIEEYRDKNSGMIKAAKKEMEKSLDEYEDALSVLEDKNREAKKIIEKHKNTLASSIYDDLEIIEGPLSKILNAKLMDGPVQSEIERMLKFFTGYDVQVERGNVYYERVFDAEGLGRRSLRVKIPGIEVGLWVDDGSGVKKHVLSQLLAEEIDTMYNLRNKALLSAMFRYSDSSLGEYFGGRYLSGLGLSIQDGVIRRPPFVLKGAAAEYTALAMQILAGARYLYIVAAGLIILYAAFVFFSAVDLRRKLAAMKFLFIYPPFIILAACGIVLWASQYLFSYFPDFIENLTIRSFAKHLSFTAAGRLALPLVVVFGTIFVAGLVLRKFMRRSAGDVLKNS
ncbi:MAG: hypothetical protein A2W19_14640 [Spirochaetes bacterium RBG_16_49_21]|nr:MAG: hypothetical protein A2W19_14640 [Spirochaetes bacterium RBG_16_49_21]